MSELTNLKIGMRTLTFFYFNGVVENRRDSSQTTNTYEQGSNRLVSSHTEHRSDLVVRNAAGDFQQVNAAAAHVSIQEGARVTLVMASTREKGEQPYVSVYNHDTGQAGYFAKGVNDAAGPPLYNMGIILAVLVCVIGVMNFSAGKIVPMALAAAFFYELYRRRKLVRAHADQVRIKHGNQGL